MSLRKYGIQHKLSFHGLGIFFFYSVFCCGFDTVCGETSGRVDEMWKVEFK